MELVAEPFRGYWCFRVRREKGNVLATMGVTSPEGLILSGIEAWFLGEEGRLISAEDDVGGYSGSAGPQAQVWDALFQYFGLGARAVAEAYSEWRRIGYVIREDVPSTGGYAWSVFTPGHHPRGRAIASRTPPDFRVVFCHDCEEDTSEGSRHSLQPDAQERGKPYGCIRCMRDWEDALPILDSGDPAVIGIVQPGSVLFARMSRLGAMRPGPPACV